MRSVGSATIAHLQAREGVIPRQLLWIVAKNRATALEETIGLWDGIDTADFTVISGETGESVTRTYVGAGSLLEISEIPLVSDLSVRTVTVSLSGISDAVDTALRGYDPRLAPVEIHRALYDPATMSLVAPPIAHFVGSINSVSIPTPAAGGEAIAEVELVSDTRQLTRTNPAKKSDETQQLRSGDRFRKYTSTSGMVALSWGENSKSTIKSSVGLAKR